MRHISSKRTNYIKHSLALNTGIGVWNSLDYEYKNNKILEHIRNKNETLFSSLVLSNIVPTAYKKSFSVIIG